MGWGAKQVLFPANRDRRSARRYPVECEAEYRRFPSDGKTYQAFVLDISTTGLLLRCDQSLRTGAAIEVTIPWPAPEGTERRFILYAVGHIIRAAGFHIAMRI